MLCVVDYKSCKSGLERSKNFKWARFFEVQKNLFAHISEMRRISRNLVDTKFENFMSIALQRFSKVQQMQMDDMN